MITKITCRYSFEVLDFHCNDFGFTFNIGVSYLGIYKTSLLAPELINVPWFGSDGKHQMNILLFYYDFNLDVELLACALLTNSIHSNRSTEQPFVLFNLLFCCLIIGEY